MEELKNQNNQSKGWECPICGKINSPYVNQCSCRKDSNISENNTYIPRSQDGRQILID